MTDPAEDAGPPSARAQRALLARLFRENARDHAGGYALALALLLVVSGATAATAYLIGPIVDEIFVERRSEALYGIALAIVVVFAVKGVAGFVSAVILGRIGNNIVSRIRLNLYDSFLGQTVSFVRREEVGSIVSRFDQFANAARGAINLLVVSIGRDVMTLIGLVGVMVWTKPWLSLFALVVAPPAVALTGMLIRRIKSIARSEIQIIGAIGSTLRETLQGFPIVKAFTIESEMRRTMDAAVADAERKANGIVVIGAVTVPMMETLGGFAIAAAVVFGGGQVVNGTAEPGGFFTFIAALLAAYEPARRLARFSVDFQKCMVGVDVMYRLIDQKPDFEERPDASALAVDRGAVRFENVSFAYGEEPALVDLTLDFEAGRATALVGPSGAGKSTIFALIERFYDVGAGRVTIDGQDLREVSQRSLRGSVALVTQDSFLFQGSFRHNIALGRPGATDEQIRQAARDANAEEFILETPGGYDGQVGPGGDRLSGGQRQRVAIARAMLRDAPILLLDEATSALDTISEAKVQEALARLMRGRTTIVIAHRLSTIRSVDRIHVLRQGRLIESGSHAELLVKEGLYAELHAMQMAGEAEPAA